MKRREFMARAIAGGAAAAVGMDSAFGQDAKEAPAGKKPATVAGGIQRFRVLGRTGLWVSDIGMGTGQLRHPGVALRALELGVNYFDTAPDYGEAEVILGDALKTAKVDRNQVVIATKMCERGPYPSHLGMNPSKPLKVEDIVRCCEASLERMKLDYVDVLMVHAIGEPRDDRRMESEELPKAIEQLKKAGKIRFAGASSHGPNNTPPLLKRVVTCGFIDMLMPALNYLKDLGGSTPDFVAELLATAKERNVGIIAMKTVPSEKQSQELTDLKKKFADGAAYPHICFTWALAQEPVAGLVKTMTTVQQVEEYVASSGAKLAAVHVEALEAYAAAVGPTYCRIGCGECQPSCPSGVPIADLLRFNEYFVNYGLEKHAMRRFADVGGHKAMAACAGCSAPCEAACRYGLSVRSLLTSADQTLHFDPYDVGNAQSA